MTTMLVTGATRGLGRETVRRLVGLGHTVYLGARNPDAGAKVAAELGAELLVIDVADEESVRAAAGRVGALDVLVNNAGIAGDQTPVDGQTAADIRAVFETNVVGAHVVLQAFAGLLDASAAPVIVNVSSAVGSMERSLQPESRWRMLAYPMSKAALNMMTVQYALAHPRWRVNSVTPGLTATEFTPSTTTGGWSVEEGAEVIVRLATIGADGPTGEFFEKAGPVPW